MTTRYSRRTARSAAGSRQFVRAHSTASFQGGAEGFLAERAARRGGGLLDVGSATTSAAYVAASQALVAIHKWTFLLGQGFCAGAENGLLLGYLMYRTRLVPRPLAVLGLIGGALAVASAIAELSGLYGQVSAPAAILVFPEALFEAALDVWLIVKGFRPSPVIEAPAVLQDA